MNAFVSYAQNQEDTLLWRALHDVGIGTYVDIGAYSPEEDSVTRAFYDHGWSGVNIEPVSSLWEELRAARPRDVNLRLAVGARRGECDFFEIPGTGLSTLDRDLAERHRRGGFTVTATRVSVRPLREIWDEFVRGEVHFLKIDVEGAERDVLAGADLLHQRPWIVVVEATAPMTDTPTHDSWESLLIGARYRFAHSDGLNRYYVAEERAELEGRFRAPDGHTDVSRTAELEALRADLPPERRFDPARVSFLGHDQPAPTLREPTSQLCTESQLREPVYRAWCEALAEAPKLQRKQWAYVYVLQALAVHGLLAAGRRGLGFGCGREPLPAVMAGRGCEIVATDRVSPDLEDFDFLWSSCAFEHLGSIQGGLDFVVDAMACLRPGGLAVHTTEFNLSSNYSTVEAHDLVIFRRHDIEALIVALEQAGHDVSPLNLNPGTGPVDRYVDLPPYRPEPHTRFRLYRYVVTSLGLIVKKGT